MDFWKNETGETTAPTGGGRQTGGLRRATATVCPGRSEGDAENNSRAERSGKSSRLAVGSNLEAAAFPSQRSTSDPAAPAAVLIVRITTISPQSSPTTTAPKGAANEGDSTRPPRGRPYLHRRHRR